MSEYCTGCKERQDIIERLKEENERLNGRIEELTKCYVEATSDAENMSEDLNESDKQTDKQRKLIAELVDIIDMNIDDWESITYIAEPMAKAKKVAK